MANCVPKSLSSTSSVDIGSARTIWHDMIGLMPMVRELEARLAADVEFKGGGA